MKGKRVDRSVSVVEGQGVSRACGADAFVVLSSRQ